MQSNALRIDDFVLENAEVPAEAWEVTRLRIALQAEAACNLPGNATAPDFELFIDQYKLEDSFA